MLVLVACEEFMIHPSSAPTSAVIRCGLDRAGPTEMTEALTSLQPDVLVTGRMLDESVAKAWRSSLPNRPLVVLSIVRQKHLDRFRIDWSEIAQSLDFTTLMGRAERALTIRRHRNRRAADVTRPGTPRTATLVGCGIVNLLTAAVLQRAGFRLRVLDSGPNPNAPHAPRYPGCTMGGGNARMFTLTEADIYRPFSDDGRSLFEIPAVDGGWRVRSNSNVDTAERGWLDELHDVPAWTARRFATDTYRFSRIAGRLWGHILADYRDDFRAAGLREGILRLYSEEDRLAADVLRHRGLGADTATLTAGQAAGLIPSIADACEKGLVAGALMVPGFTVLVHDLARRLVDDLAARGVAFHWSVPVRGIAWSGQRAAALITDQGEITDHNYVVSPGVPGAGLLKGAEADGRIQGVLGTWLTLPAPTPTLPHSLKIARTGVVAPDINVTVGRDDNGVPKLFLGSGYGWVGANEKNNVRSNVHCIEESLRDTARTFFPELHKDAGLDESRTLRHCVRPWTASSLGVFETRPTVSGGALVITGGHNTGGFAQSPAVAIAVLSELTGRPHLMSALYHPLRAQRLVRRDKGKAA